MVEQAPMRSLLKLKRREQMVQQKVWCWFAAMFFVCFSWCPTFASDYNLSFVRQTAPAGGPGGFYGMKWNSVATDSDNNVYLAGVTWPHVSQWYDIALSKLDAAGNTLWLKTFGTTGTDEVNKIVVDKNKNIYIGGKSTSETGNDAYLAKLDNAGNIIWEWHYGNNDTFFGEQVSSLVLDPVGNVYVTGFVDRTWNTADFAFLAKMDNNGQLIWLKKLESESMDFAYGVALDSKGNIYVVGATFGNINGLSKMGSPFPRGYVMKFDPDGNRHYELYVDESSEIRDIAIDSFNNIYVAGTIIGRELRLGLWDFVVNDGDGDIVPGGVALVTGLDIVTKEDIGYDDADIFVAKLGPESNQYEYQPSPPPFYHPENLWFPAPYGWKTSFDVKWGRELGSFGSSDHATGLVVDSNGNILVTGYTRGNISDQTVSDNEEDVFLMQFNPAGDLLWTKQVGSNNQFSDRSDFAYACAIDRNNNVFVAGSTNGYFTDHDAIDRDALLIKYTPVAPTSVCDVNNDGRIDSSDINLIFAARGTKVLPGDLRDLDGDLLITVSDARGCTLRCTNASCKQ